MQRITPYKKAKRTAIKAVLFAYKNKALVFFEKSAGKTLSRRVFPALSVIILLLDSAGEWLCGACGAYDLEHVVAELFVEDESASVDADET